MTLNELKEAIANSPNKEWYQNYKLEIKYKNINFKTTIQGIVNIYQFVTDQADGFSKIEGLPDELNTIKQRFINAKNIILGLFRQNSINRTQWDNSLGDISGHKPTFLIGTPETDFLLKVHKERPGLYAGAFEYLNGATSRVNNKQYFDGYVLAFEFMSKDFSQIAERTEAEKKSINSIRASFQEKLGEAEREVIEHIAKSNTKFDEYASKIDVLKTEKETTYNEWFENTSTSFSSFHTVSASQIKDLEDLYRKKLQLEAPAQYWNNRARKIRREGYCWLVGLIVSIGVGAGVLIWVLSEIADGTFQGIFNETGSAVKWSVALITLISFLAYAIRVLSKLTFSSFHLVRDAEEREQLTYVYLALQEQKGIDQTERHLIMQSLFSRADSGLLKDDASPTMPGIFVDQMTKNKQ